MVSARTWPEDWPARRRGVNCPMCAGLEANEPYGVRVFEGRWGDAYLGRHPVRPGYTLVIWKGRHVAEATELSSEEAAGFWSEVARIARAVESRYQPAKMNWLVLGNGVPHLHVHLVPRPTADANAGLPMENEAFLDAESRPLARQEIETEAAALRSVIGTPHDG
jgi:diadenosine tetraphosphate (Ap4A) HIT family hydrolase